MNEWTDEALSAMMGHRFLEGAKSNSTSTTTSSQTIQDSLFAYGSFFLVMFPIYCVVRLHFPRVYAVRQWAPGHTTPMASDQFGYLSWLWKVYSFSQEELLEGIGLDSLCFIRILNMGFRLACVGCFNSIWLFPVYMTSEQDPELKTDDDRIREVSVNTMIPGDIRFVATVIAAYIFFGYTFYTIFKEFDWFITQRHLWLRKFHSRNYTVLVRNIPDEMRSDDALKKHFQTLYGRDKVLAAHVCLFLSDLESMVSQREACVENLEHALAELVLGGKRPKHVLLMHSEEVDAIDHFDDELKKLNEEIQEKIIEIEEEKEQQRRRARMELELDSNVDTPLPLETSSEGGKSKKWRGVTSVRNGDEVITGNSVTISHRSTSHQKVNGVATRIEEVAEESSITEDNDDATSTLINTQVTSINDAQAIDGAEMSTSTDSASVRSNSGIMKMIKHGLKGAKERVKIFLKTFRKSDGETENPGGERAASSGFVTFTTLVATQGALQMSQHPGPFVLETDPAPDEPCNIYWGNTRKEIGVVQTGRFVSIILTIVICLFWTVVVTFIVNLANVKVVEEGLHIEGAIQDDPWLENLLALLSPLLLLILDNGLLPIILEGVTKFELPASDSLFRASSFIKMAVFTVIQTFFVSLISGSIIEAVGNVFDSPAEFIALLAEALPDQSGYFMQLLIASTCIGTLLELFRVNTLIYAGIRSCLGRRLTEKERNQPIGFFLPLSNLTVVYFSRGKSRILLYFMVMFVYSSISPLVNWFCLVFFLLLRSVYRHECIFNFPNNPDSGGQIWIYYMHVILACILISQLALMGFLTLKEFAVAIPLMVPLLVATCLVIVFLHQRHFSKGKHLAGTTCAEQDAYNAAEGIDFCAFQNDYKNPALLTRYVDADWNSGKKEAGISLSDEDQPLLIIDDMANNDLLIDDEIVRTVVDPKLGESSNGIVGHRIISATELVVTQKETDE